VEFTCKIFQITSPRPNVYFYFEMSILRQLVVIEEDKTWNQNFTSAEGVYRILHISS